MPAVKTRSLTVLGTPFSGPAVLASTDLFFRTASLVERSIVEDGSVAVQVGVHSADALERLLYRLHG